MTTTQVSVPRSPVRRALSSAGRSSAYCLVLLPLSAAAIAAALAGRPGKAAGWWQVLRERLLGAEGGRIQGPTPAPRRSAVAGHAALSALLGAAALVPLGLEVLTVLRGLLYGLVDHGPYDHSWGGPTLAGAWLAHFAIGIPIIVAAALALTGIAAVHQRLTAALAGRPRAPWVVPVALLAPLPAIAFFIAWLHQI